MMNNSHSKGDLVCLPAGVRLFQFGEPTRIDPRESTPSVKKYKDVKKPTNVLLINGGGTYNEVIYQGERWHVFSRDIYPKRLKNEQY